MIGKNTTIEWHACRVGKTSCAAAADAGTSENNVRLRLNSDSSSRIVMRRAMPQTLPQGPERDGTATVQ